MTPLEDTTRLVTNAFRRDVSSDCAKNASPGASCSSHQCLSAGCVIGRGCRPARLRGAGVTNAFRRDVSSDRTVPGHPHTRLGHQCLSAGCVIGPQVGNRDHRADWVTNAFRRDVSSDAGADERFTPAGRVTNAFRRDVSSDSVKLPHTGMLFMSPMPFGGMCHRTPRFTSGAGCASLKAVFRNLVPRRGIGFRFPTSKTFDFTIPCPRMNCAGRNLSLKTAHQISNGPCSHGASIPRRWDLSEQAEQMG